jgi:hypothetical protein
MDKMGKLQTCRTILGNFYKKPKKSPTIILFAAPTKDQ